MEYCGYPVRQGSSVDDIEQEMVDDRTLESRLDFKGEDIFSYRTYIVVRIIQL